MIYKSTHGGIDVAENFLFLIFKWQTNGEFIYFIYLTTFQQNWSVIACLFCQPIKFYHVSKLANTISLIL